MNAERREIENEMKQQALDSLKSLHNSPDVNKVGITLYDETWHQVSWVLWHRESKTGFIAR